MRYSFERRALFLMSFVELANACHLWYWNLVFFLAVVMLSPLVFDMRVWRTTPSSWKSQSTAGNFHSIRKNVMALIHLAQCHMAWLAEESYQRLFFPAHQLHPNTLTTTSFGN